MVVVAYDVHTDSEGGQRRLRRVAKACESVGQRVQNSVFECLVEPVQWERLRHRLEEILDPKEDCLRYYFLGSNWRRRVESYGIQKSYDPEGPLIV